MDKIVTRDWMKSFGKIDQQVIHASERYFEVTTAVAEPHLASGVSWTIGMPGLTLDNVIIRPENKLIIGDITEKETIQSVFVVDGYADSTFDFGKKYAVMEQRRHAFQYSSGYTAEHRIISNHFHGLSIDIHPEFLKSMMTTTAGDIDELYNRFIKGESFQSVLSLPSRMHDIIHNVLACPFKGMTRYLFIESKILELLALQIEQMQTTSSLMTSKSNGDLEKLKAVREYIEYNYLEPLSLAGLCKHFALNEFKLKKGYKELFHTTVFGHINALRMEKARQMLMQNRMTISAISDLIGYKNIGSFSIEFKKRFGYPPSKFRGY